MHPFGKKLFVGVLVVLIVMTGSVTIVGAKSKANKELDRAMGLLTGRVDVGYDENAEAMADEIINKWLEKGNARAFYYKAHRVCDSLYVRKGLCNAEDMSKPLDYLEKGADKGYPYAQFVTAMYYTMGWGTKPDGEKAVSYLEKVDGNENSKARANDLLAYHEDGVPGKYYEGKKWLYRTVLNPDQETIEFVLSQGKRDYLKWYLENSPYQPHVFLYDAGVQKAKKALETGEDEYAKQAKMAFSVLGENRTTDLESYGYEWLGLLYTRARLDEPNNEKAQKWFRASLDAEKPDDTGYGSDLDFRKTASGELLFADGYGELLLAHNYVQYYKTGMPPMEENHDGHRIPNQSHLEGTFMVPDKKFVEQKIEEGDYEYLQYAVLDDDLREFVQAKQRELEDKQLQKNQERLNDAVENPSKEHFDLYMKACQGNLDVPLDAQTSSGNAAQGNGSKACKLVAKYVLDRFKSELTCSNAVDRHKKIHAKHQDNKDAKQGIHYAATEKLAECGKWESVWVDMVHWGSANKKSLGAQALFKLEQNGYPVYEKLLAFMEDQGPEAFDFDTENYGMASSHVATWLSESGRTNTCKEVVPHLEKTDAEVLGHWLRYFDTAGCTNAAPLIEKALDYDKDPNPDLREYACALIGRLGNSKNVPTVKDTAKNDPDYEVLISGVKHYPVRDKCSTALAELQ